MVMPHIGKNDTKKQEDKDSTGYKTFKHVL